MTKIKDLPFKEKMENIWYYYKWHIFFSILAVIVVISLIHSSITAPKYVLNISIVGTYDINKKDEVEKLENTLTKKFVNDSDKRKRIGLDLYGLNKIDGTLKDMDPNYYQKFSVKIAVGDVDILIINSYDFKNLMEQDIFLKLNDISEVENSKLIKKGSDVYGINVEGNKILDKIGYNTKDKVIGIIAASKNSKQAKRVMEWILDFQNN